MATDSSVFRRSPFRDLSAQAIDRLAQRARDVRFEPEERIAPLINPPRRIVLLLSGLAKLTSASVDGHERIVYVFRPGDLIGSRVFLESSPEAAYEVVAMARTEGVAVELVDFFAAGREHPEILLATTRAFTRRLGDLTDRLMAAMSQDVAVRLCRLLLDFVDIDPDRSEDFLPLAYPLTHETMAGIVGASRPHTSSVLADLEEEGIVLRQGRKLLAKPAALERYVRSTSDAGLPTAEAG